jgi:hypothetical protein
MRLKKKLLVVTLMMTIFLPLAAYAWIELDKGAWTEKNQAPSDVTRFEVVVNGIRRNDVFVCVNMSDGLTEKEAELIAGTTFIQVKGEYVWRRIETLTFDDTQIQAHYAWGHDKTDLGHVYDMSADLTTLQITVDHCF